MLAAKYLIGLVLLALAVFVWGAVGNDDGKRAEVTQCQPAEMKLGFGGEAEVTPLSYYLGYDRDGRLRFRDHNGNTAHVALCGAKLPAAKDCGHGQTRKAVAKLVGRHATLDLNDRMDPDYQEYSDVKLGDASDLSVALLARGWALPDPSSRSHRAEIRGQQKRAAAKAKRAKRGIYSACSST